MSVSNISSETIAAYLETHFMVQSERPFTLIVGKLCVPLVELYRSHSTHSAAFITAYNPYSKLHSDDENRAFNEELILDLNRLNITAIPGVGQDPAGKWPGEPSLLALGIEEDLARQLGNKYEQNAIVWCGSNAVPKLILLR